MRLFLPLVSNMIYFQCKDKFDEIIYNKARQAAASAPKMASKMDVIKDDEMAKSENGNGF